MRIALPLLAAAMLSGGAPPPSVEVRIESLRNAHGLVRICLTRDPKQFPNCRADPKALKLNAPAADAHKLSFDAVEPGTYAVAVLHDENRNGRLDTFAKLPREGFGFSRNPAIRFGPPHFQDARFAVGQGRTLQQVKVRYLL